MSFTTNGAIHLSRRDIARLVGAGAILAPCPVNAALAGLGLPRKAVVGFHADAPWLDQTGRDLPYTPPLRPARPAPDRESLSRLGHFL